MRRIPEGAADFIFQLSTGYQHAQILYVTAKLGLADMVRDGPKSAEELTRRTGARGGEVMNLLLRILTSWNVLDVGEDGRYALGTAGGALLSDHPRRLRDLIVANCETHYGAWGRLLEMVMSGGCGFRLETGQDIWARLAEDPDLADSFYRGMLETAQVRSMALLEVCDLSAASHVVDVGAGYGGLGIALLRALPHLRVTLFDLPHTVEAAKRLVRATGLTDRCRVVGGDFFEQLPAGADIYILNRVLPDWGDDQVTEILARCRSAMSASSRLLVVARFLAGGRDEDVGTLLKALNAQTMAAGRHRTEEEHRMLLRRAGLGISRIAATGGGISVIEARRLERVER